MTKSDKTGDSAKAKALDEIIERIGQYMHPESGVDAHDLIADIAGVIERKTDYRFVMEDALADEET